MLSPLLYCIFVNDLLRELENSGLGVSIDGDYCGAPMYADDLALIASSPSDLQKMLDITEEYANKWRYSFNIRKTKVMVFGSRRTQDNPAHTWTLNGQPIDIVESHHHLGVLLTSRGPNTCRIIKHINMGRASFYSLNRVGSRFGCLHPTTTHKLYNSICIPKMLYGAELWNTNKSEMLMLERANRKILRTIQGLPTRCPTVALTSLIGASSIKDTTQRNRLTFLASTLALKPSALPKRILLSRSRHATPTSWCSLVEKDLDQLNLPDLSHWTSAPPHKKPWKKAISNIIKTNSYLAFDDETSNKPDLQWLNMCDINPNKPAAQWLTTVGNPTATNRSNFRMRLLAGCHGLESDASRFRYRRNNTTPGDPSCKLCGGPREDAAHFIATCSSLEDKRRELLQQAPPNSNIPDPARDPELFTSTILGSHWINDTAVQTFVISFLSNLKQHRADQITN